MARFLTHVSASLQEHGCQVLVLGARELADAQQNNPLLRMLSRLHTPWLVIYWIFVFDAWRRAGYPIIVVTSQEYVVPFAFKKQIAIYHDLIQYFYPRNKKSALYYRYYLRWISRKLGFVYCVTKATGRMVSHLFGKVPYHICGVPIDRQFLSSGDAVGAGEHFHAVWVGTLAAHKNYGRVLDYIKRDAGGVESVAMVVPRNQTADLRGEADALGLGNRIQVFSDLTEDELSDIYHCSDIVMSTSELEGFCMPVLEAALCGCRPVVPDRATFRENFGHFGILVPPHGDTNPKDIGDQPVLDRNAVASHARAFHTVVRDRWKASLDEIANAAMAGGKVEITRAVGLSYDERRITLSSRD
ncbi:glycosyltransferase [Paraburkholderia bengalensis]|uniref:Glycosyltransferase n=1 Tax=Paraburkholderia bengalensis TaxID=2747562 RepID=A0ABU8IX79_9BURK